MQIDIRGRNLDVPSRFRELAHEKLGRMERYGVDLARIDVEVSKENNPRLAERAIEVELTCHGRGPLLRAEAHASDKFAALDLACETLKKRLRRASEKRRSLRRRAAKVVPAGVPVEEIRLDEAEEEADAEAFAPQQDGEQPEGVVYAEGPVLVWAKTHETRPMTVGDAVDNLELIGHDFFFFFDSEANRPSVVYRRRGYDYGLIRLDIENGEPLTH